LRQVKIGIAGVGHMGRNHCKVVNLLKSSQFIGVYDIDSDKCKEVAVSYGVTPFTSYIEMLSAVDAVIIAVPTTFHYQYAEKAIKSGKHILIEKPFVNTLEEAEKLIALNSKNNNCIIQVGHIERFNPVIEIINNSIDDSNIISIEARRLSETERNLDVDVVLDLMIHDIDIILNLVKSDLRSITAKGSFSDNNQTHLDIVHVLLTFQNGVIANLIANRISTESLRTLSITEKQRVITANYITRELQIYKKTASDLQTFNEIENSIETIKVPPIEPIQAEIQHFIHSIINNTPPIIGPNEAKKALSVVMNIRKSIRTGETISLF